MDKKIKRAFALYAPMILYLGFIILFLVTRFILLSLITANANMNPQRFPRQYNLTPFATITTYINSGNQKFSFLDVIGNILLFVPMGIYIHLLNTKKRIWLSAILSLLSTAIIEITQYLLATGSFDIDDILMNFIGAFIGVILFHIIYCVCKKDSDLATLVLSAISITVIPLLVATVIQYALWISISIFVPTSAFLMILSYVGMYYFIYRNETKQVKWIYCISCLALCLLFYAFVIPMVSPKY